MISNDMKTASMEKLMNIIGNYGNKLSLEDISTEDVEKAMLKVADIKVKEKGTVSLPIKYILYNLENFRPEVRSVFENKVFDIWYGAYQTMERKETADMQESEQVTEAPVVEKQPEPFVEKEAEAPVVEKQPEPFVEKEAEAPVVEKEPEPDMEKEAEAPVIEKESEPVVEEKMEEPVAAIEPERGEKTEKPSIAADTFQPRRKRDWFDLLLDASAALMRFFMRIKIRKR